MDIPQLSSEANWSAYVLAVVFEGESGWRDSLEQHSTATRAVLARLTDLVAGKQTCWLRHDDIVHGDLALDNLLVVGERVSGIVDWDAAGSGDRSLDLSKLLFMPMTTQRSGQICGRVSWQSVSVRAGYLAGVQHPCAAGLVNPSSFSYSG